MRSFARLVVSPPSNRFETRSIRCSLAIVGLVSTRATSGSDITSRTCARRWPHSSTLPSSLASSKIAFAYLLAAAVATRNLHDRLVDQLPVPVIVERLADDLFGRGDHQVCDLAAYRTHRLIPLGFDLLTCRLDRPLRFLFGFLPHLLPKLLRRLRGGVDHTLRGLAGVGQLLLGFLQTLLGRGAGFLGLLQLFGDLPLASLGQRHDPRIYVPREDRQHDQERDQLDDHGPVDRDNAGFAREIHLFLSPVTSVRST